MVESSQIQSQVLEHIHYIQFPSELSENDLRFLEDHILDWSALGVDLHVLDLRGMKSAPERFFKDIKLFNTKLPQGHLVSLNMTGELQKEVSRLKLDLVFSALQNVSELTQKRQISPDDLRRLLIRYLIRGAYSAVEVALNSTVSCDENYLAKPDKVSVQDLDMMAVIDVRGDFLNAQIRLAAASEVLKRLASRMLGGSTVIEDEMIESMALELLNLIYGHAKSYLNDKESFQLPAAIPRLVRKDQFDTLKRSTSVANLSILPLVTPMGSIYVEVDIP